MTDSERYPDDMPEEQVLDEVLADWVDGRLDEVELCAFEQRMASDPGFAAAAEEYRATVDLLRDELPDLAPPPADLVGRTMVQLQAGQRPRLLPWLGSLAAAAALIAAVVYLRDFASAPGSAVQEPGAQRPDAHAADASPSLGKDSKGAAGGIDKDEELGAAAKPPLTSESRRAQRLESESVDPTQPATNSAEEKQERKQEKMKAAPPPGSQTGAVPRSRRGRSSEDLKSVKSQSQVEEEAELKQLVEQSRSVGGRVTPPSAAPKPGEGDVVADPGAGRPNSPPPSPAPERPAARKSMRAGAEQPDGATAERTREHLQRALLALTGSAADDGRKQPSETIKRLGGEVEVLQRDRAKNKFEGAKQGGEERDAQKKSSWEAEAGESKEATRSRQLASPRQQDRPAELGDAPALPVFFVTLPPAAPAPGGAENPAPARAANKEAGNRRAKEFNLGQLSRGPATGAAGLGGVQSLVRILVPTSESSAADKAPSSKQPESSVGRPAAATTAYQHQAGDQVFLVRASNKEVTALLGKILELTRSGSTRTDGDAPLAKKARGRGAIASAAVQAQILELDARQAPRVMLDSGRAALQAASARTGTEPQNTFFLVLRPATK